MLRGPPPRPGARGLGRAALKDRDKDNKADLFHHTRRIAGNEETRAMSTEPAKPDTGTDVETMTIEAVQAELQRYKPGTTKSGAKISP